MNKNKLAMAALLGTAQAMLAEGDLRAIDKAESKKKRAKARKKLKPLKLTRVDPSRHNIRRYDQVQRDRKIARQARRLVFKRYKRKPDEILSRTTA